jgi:RNA polymerase sigma-70 factor, ECF subfamily
MPRWKYLELSPSFERIQTEKAMATAFPESSDEQLLDWAKAGDEQAFASLYRRRQAALYRYAFQMSASEALAEDVTQEVFLALLRNSAGFDPKRGTVAGYLFGIARHLVLEALSRGRRMLSLEQDGAGGETHAAPGDLLADMTRQQMLEGVRRAVLALPPHYREAVVLCDLEEMDYAEAAALLGCAVGTVRSRLHRARGLLSEKFQGSGPVRCYP